MDLDPFCALYRLFSVISWFRDAFSAYYSLFKWIWDTLGHYFTVVIETSNKKTLVFIIKEIGAKFCAYYSSFKWIEGQKTLKKCMKIDPAISSDHWFGRGDSFAWESGGAIWEEVREESAGSRGRGRELRQAHEVWSRGQRWGARSSRRSGAEARSRGAVTNGALERSGRRLWVTEPQILTLGKNPKASLIFGEINISLGACRCQCR